MQVWHLPPRLANLRSQQRHNSTSFVATWTATSRRTRRFVVVEGMRGGMMIASVPEMTATPEHSPRLAAIASFQQLMLTVVKNCAAIDVRSYELASVPRLAAELRPATLTLLAEARSLISSLLDTCEIMQKPSTVVRSIPPDGLGELSDRRFERAVDAAVASKRASLATIDEVAFMAQFELRQRAERLERLTLDCEAASMLDECDSSLRRIRKSLNAVGLSIARVLGVAPLAEYTSELESSLALRRGLASFRRRITKGGEPAANKLRERFSQISNQIEILVSWDMYSGMRVRDRLLLRGLQERLLAWLNGTNATPEAGLRLWQDIIGCLEMFALVNRRQELVEHDAALLQRAVTALREHAPQALVEATLWQELKAMDGRDDELDLLLKRPAPQVQQLLPMLERFVEPSRGTEQAPRADDMW